MTIRAPLDITITSMRNCLGTKDGAQFRNPKSHTVPLHKTRCQGCSTTARRKPADSTRKPNRGLETMFRYLAILLKQNTQHSRRKTPYKGGQKEERNKKKKKEGILEPNKHLIFPFPLRINTGKG